MNLPSLQQTSAVFQSSRQEPVLSICIPTFNRAEALDGLLFMVCSQIDHDRLAVDVHVSDNASTDRTEATVTKWSDGRDYLHYHRNTANIGGVRNFWKVTQYVTSSHFWLLGDDAVPLPGSIKHVVDIVNTTADLKFLILCGTNIIADQSPFIRSHIDLVSGVLTTRRGPEFLASYWLQTLGCISYLVLATDSWRQTGYEEQPPYFIYPQIRSLIEVCTSDGAFVFSNRACVVHYRASGDHNYWYKSKAPVSIVIEFPWLQRFARQQGVAESRACPFFRGYFLWRLKCWIRMLLEHPFYSRLYGEAFSLEAGLFHKATFGAAALAVIPLRRILRRIAAKRGVVFLDYPKNSLDAKS